MNHDVFSNILHFFAVFRGSIDRRVSSISSEFCESFRNYDVLFPYYQIAIDYQNVCSEHR